MPILSFTRWRQAPSTGPSNCTSNKHRLATASICSGQCRGDARQKGDVCLCRERDADLASRALPVGQLILLQPVVDRTDVDAEAAGHLPDRQLTRLQCRGAVETERVADVTHVPSSEFVAARRAQ